MIKIQELEKGQIVYECQSGENHKLTITSDPEHKEGGWRATAMTEHGEEVELFCSDLGSIYGPRLYAEKQYAE